MRRIEKCSKAISDHPQWVFDIAGPLFYNIAVLPGPPYFFLRSHGLIQGNKLGLKLLQEQLRRFGKALGLLPYQIHPQLQPWLQRAEAKAAILRVDKFVKADRIP